MVNLILWAIIGAIACWVASSIIGGQRSGLMNAGICAVGAVAGELVMFLLNSIMGSGVTQFNTYSFIVAVIGIAIFMVVLQNKYNGGITKAKQKRPQYAYNTDQHTYEL